MKKATGIILYVMLVAAGGMIVCRPAVAGDADFETRVDGLIGQLEHGPELVFYIAFYTDGDRGIVEEAIPMIREQLFNMPFVLVEEEVPLPEDAYVEIRDKYYAGRMLEILAENLPKDSVGYLAITDSDIYVGRRPHVRGLANPELGVAIVSTHRLKYPSRYRYKLRVLKEVLHELGHVLGQEHCEDNSYCIMGFSHGLSELDAKYREFCPYHRNELREHLKEKGIDLEKYKIPEKEDKNDGDG
ncbi:hypothetical protein ACFLQK_02940 [bacterium]